MTSANYKGGKKQVLVTEIFPPAGTGAGDDNSIWGFSENIRVKSAGKRKRGGFA
jgi:hypothetical protein